MRLLLSLFFLAVLAFCADRSLHALAELRDWSALLHFATVVSAALVLRVLSELELK